MNFIKSLFVAFGMFSSIPVPVFEWNKENMRYMMCGFPFVGAVTGLACFLCLKYGLLHVPSIILTLILLLIPVIISGGIHLDGFADTFDALASHASQERKLEILKDSHCGSFSIIAIVLYFISYFAFTFELIECSKKSNLNETALFYAFNFFICRLLSALSVASFKCARNTGLVKTFADSSAKVFTAVFCTVFLVLSFVFLSFINPYRCLTVFIPVCAFFIYYYFFTKKQFGGITGDTSGFLVQNCELLFIVMLWISAGGSL